MPKRVHKKDKIHTGSLQGFGRVDIDGSGLVGDGGGELVVDDSGGVELDAGGLDGVGSSTGLSEGGDGLSDLVEGQLDITTVGTGHLVLGLVAQDNDARRSAVSSDQAAGSLGNG